MATSCEVRKPSKKCRKGTRDRSVAACATSAKSCASWTSDAHSIAQPVDRTAMTSEWSPKIDSACVATARAATCSTVGVSSPADLEHRGDHEQQALARGERRRQRALLHGTVQRRRGTALGLHLDHLGHRAPEVRASGGAPRVGELAHGRGRRDRVDRADVGEAVGDERGGLVAVEAADARPGRRGHVDGVGSTYRRLSHASQCAPVRPSVAGRPAHITGDTDHVVNHLGGSRSGG